MRSAGMSSPTNRSEHSSHSKTVSSNRSRTYRGRTRWLEHSLHSERYDMDGERNGTVLAVAEYPGGRVRLLVLTPGELTRDPRARRQAQLGLARGLEVVGLCAGLDRGTPIELEGVEVVRAGGP